MADGNFGTAGAEASALSADFNREQRYTIKKSADTSGRKSKYSL
ncbi:hypothetical protein [Paenibacillus tianjinensis]|nr:hypothetical protein [Paenibacillus tianjinensis]